ncbi:hypothetical protein GGX14DRAFT_514072 [Mycena pura]|uniref:RING-CH-type domain-containing protein n=1 Tax=Mycena pura TaxID=153505 RepID=A0AAD6YKU9_9AGAR|nr:hypothetical protein GGX14DRAFT_514072 [Mycena pura]
MSDRPPTLADLRIKLCYICREEEKVGSAAPPRAWVHPCTCTLVAHESCLLEWIKSSEGTGREASARQCPQCKTEYEVESNNPTALRFLRAVDKNLGGVDLGFYLIGFGFVVRAVYRAQISYGAWALRRYIGSEMFDLLLTDDRSRWPLIAKLNIVMIPASLIVARLGLPHPISAVVATWPAFAFLPSGHLDDAEVAAAIDRAGSSPTANLPWPPSPFVFGFIVLPICRRLYGYYFTKFSRWALGIHPAPPRPRNAPAVRPNLLQRLFDNMEHAADGRAGRQAAGEDGNAAPANANVDEREVISVDIRRAGRLIGGALLIPAIASQMGRVLHRLSKHFSLLKRFLAVRPEWRGFLPPPPLRRYTVREVWRRATASGSDEIGATLKFVLRAVWGDVRKFDECDPVWWRNSVGFGLFVVAKDFLQLLHLWLSQRELTTRRVKNRDFSGVDPRELDLLPSHGALSGITLPGAL